MSHRIEVVLDDQGRLVFPALLQRQLGLRPGMTLVVEQETADAAYLRVQTEQPRLVDEQGVLVIQTQACDDIGNAIQNERNQRVVELLRRVGL